MLSFHVCLTRMHISGCLSRSSNCAPHHHPERGPYMCFRMNGLPLYYGSPVYKVPMLRVQLSEKLGCYTDRHCEITFHVTCASLLARLMYHKASGSNQMQRLREVPWPISKPANTRLILPLGPIGKLDGCNIRGAIY